MAAGLNKGGNERRVDPGVVEAALRVGKRGEAGMRWTAGYQALLRCWSASRRLRRLQRGGFLSVPPTSFRLDFFSRVAQYVAQARLWRGKSRHPQRQITCPRAIGVWTAPTQGRLDEIERAPSRSILVLASILKHPRVMKLSCGKRRMAAFSRNSHIVVLGYIK
jgi:hypothetical protein